MVMANVKFRNIVHDQFLGVSVQQGYTVQYSTPFDHHWPLYESIWHLDSIFHVLPIPTEYAYILLCLYSSSIHIIPSFHLAVQHQPWRSQPLFLVAVTASGSWHYLLSPVLLR